MRRGAHRSHISHKEVRARGWSRPLYKFVGKNSREEVPYGAIVRVIRFLSKGQVVFEYNGKIVKVPSTLLREFR